LFHIIVFIIRSDYIHSVLVGWFRIILLHHSSLTNTLLKI